MKTLWLVLFTGFLMTAGMSALKAQPEKAQSDAETSDCDMAVDMSDSHDLERFHDCQPEDSGVNRLLRRLISSSDSDNTEDLPQPQEQHINTNLSANYC